MLFLIILVLTFISGFILPWWVIALIAFIAAWFFGKSSGQAFLAGFGGVFIAWSILILLKTIPNDNILVNRVIQLFPLPHWWVLLLLISALIGGLVGGMAALSGTLMKNVFKK
jgi:hypothetical protein